MNDGDETKIVAVAIRNVSAEPSDMTFPRATRIFRLAQVCVSRHCPTDHRSNEIDESRTAGRTSIRRYPRLRAQLGDTIVNWTRFLFVASFAAAGAAAQPAPAGSPPPTPQQRVAMLKQWLDAAKRSFADIE